MRSVFMLLFGLTALGATGCADTCEPAGGDAYCEGDTLKVCTADGDKGVMEETDCAASGEVCASNASQTSDVAAQCRPADCEEGWACFSADQGDRMCDLAADNVYVCVDEGDDCFGWERVQACADLGADLTCVETEDPKDATCQ